MVRVTDFPTFANRRPKLQPEAANERAFRRRTAPHILLCCVFSASILFASACSETDTTPNVAVEQPVGVQLETPRITLTDPGTGPLQVIEFADVDQKKQKLTLSIADGFTQSITTPDKVTEEADDAAKPSNTFSAPVTAHTLAAENSESSSRSVFLELDTPTLTGDITQKVTDIDTARGFAFGWFANNQGQVSSLNFTAPVTASDEARAITEQYLSALVGIPIVFPTEKIGTGATWIVESRITGQSAMLQTITYTLKKLDETESGTTVTLDVDVQRRPALGALQSEETDDELKVLSATTTSEGTLEVNLSQPLPSSGDIEMTTRVVYGEENSQVRVVQDTATAVRFESR